MKRKGSAFALFGAFLMIIVSVLFGVKALGIFSGLSQAEKKLQQLEALVSGEAAGTEYAAESGMESGTEQQLSGYQTLYERNKDFAAWISIDGTKVNYPVMFAPDRQDYYLNRDFDGAYSAYGLPYLDEASNPFEEGNCLVIYGHNMKNGEMFQSLTRYSDYDFYEAHPVINLDFPDKRTRFEIAYVFPSSSSDAGFAYEQYAGELSREETNTFIESCNMLSLYDTGVNVTPDKQLLILSTCFYAGANDRFVVVGVRSE